MQSSRAEKLFAAVLTFLTVGSVVTLSYFLLVSGSYPTLETEADRLQQVADE